MHFSLQYWIDNILPVREQEITLNYGGSHDITCILRKASEHEKKHPHREDFAICIVNSKVEPKDKIAAMFESIAQRRLPEGSQDPTLWLKSPERKSGQVDFMDVDGLIKNNVPPPLEILPSSLQSFIEDVRKELRDYAIRTVRIIRWRLNLSGSHNPIREHKGFSWSFDNQCWYDAPHTIHIHIEGAVLASPLLGKIKNEIVDLVQNRQNEPLGHELFREAWGQRRENTRSALVIGIAAAETGVKQCISSLVPASQWLIENLPSPPIERILAEYFPTLPVKNRINNRVAIPKSIVEKLKKGIHMRNSIIHGKSTSLSFENVTEILSAVGNLLHLLDYYCGHTWAFNNITTDEQETLLQELK